MDEPSITKVHEDERGAIYSISLPDNRELMLLFSKAGVFRGGHSHDCNEVVMLLSGRMKYYKRGINGDGSPGVEQVMTLMAGDVSRNNAGVVHMGEFLDDSWVIEQKFAEKDAWSQMDYEPYRRLVRKTME